jgi:crossover junction endodeoxyribonuclease RuvC
MAKQKKAEKTSLVLTSPNTKRILGLDLSLTGTGWVLWTSDYTWDSGLIDTDGMSDLTRMDHILTEISNKIPVNELKQSDTLVVMEDFSFASKGASLFQIAGLGFLIRHWLWKHDVQFVLVPPTVLKKFVGGAGNIDKNLMLLKTYKLWGQEFSDDNICDAYGLSRIGRALLSWDNDLTAYQHDALKQLGKSKE